MKLQSFDCLDGVLKKVTSFQPMNLHNQGHIKSFVEDTVLKWSLASWQPPWLAVIKKILSFYLKSYSQESNRKLELISNIITY